MRKMPGPGDGIEAGRRILSNARGCEQSPGCAQISTAEKTESTQLGVSLIWCDAVERCLCVDLEPGSRPKREIADLHDASRDEHGDE